MRQSSRKVVARESYALGHIREEVLSEHLRQYPKERALVRPFAIEFDVTWGARRRAYGTNCSVYLLKPEDDISRVFGLELEVALFIFDYEPMQARTIQIVNQVMQESPLVGRAEPSLYVIVGKGSKTGEWVENYRSRNPDPRTVVALSYDQVAGIKNRFELRKLIAETLFTRDLFDYRLPVDNDLFFFGRANTISKIRDQIRKGQNTGLFGLRKTGKTSILYKIRRDAKELGFANTIYLDCKNPIIRQKTARQLLQYINSEIARVCSIRSDRYMKSDEFESFAEVVRISTKKSALCLIFDEIEFISPVAKLDKHWHTDFLDLWQLIWSTQSSCAGLSFIIGGVNAGVCETPVYGGVQNPLFSIVNIEYLRGLDQAALGRMISLFGGQMGLHFSHEAVTALAGHYGGHPLLTRMACSFIHRDQEDKGVARPVAITDEFVNRILPECDAEISAYCAHIVSELQEFYEDEYDVLMMSAVGKKSEFYEFGRDIDLTRHLISYGILDNSSPQMPRIALPVLRDFLAKDYARRSGGVIPREIVAAERRERWVREVVQRIIDDTRSLLRLLPRGSASPFGGRAFPDADLWARVTPVSRRQEFESFASTAYKVFYENVTRHLNIQNDFDIQFKSDWPSLHSALRRIKAYRDFVLHAESSPRTMERYEHYLAVDTGGIAPESTPDGWFALQQAILDELLHSIQVESATRAT